MEAEIGSAAGILWRYLNQYGEATLGRLKQGTRLTDQLLLMGLGWLAREGKLSLVREKRALKVSLKRL
jgi:hypothetical protein